MPSVVLPRGQKQALPAQSPQVCKYLPKFKQEVSVGPFTARKPGTRVILCGVGHRDHSFQRLQCCRNFSPLRWGNFAATDSPVCSVLGPASNRAGCSFPCLQEALAVQGRSRIAPSLSAAAALRREGEGWRRCPSRSVGLTAAPQAPPIPSM